MIALLSGMVAGLGHVFAGPDHLAAVAPLAVEGKQKAWAAGLRWGLGHSSGVIVVGLLFLWLRGILPVELISGWSERLVGVVLIGIGLWGLRTAMKKRLHVHTHEHAGHEHTHVHAHEATTAHKPAQPTPHSHGHTAFAVGTLHGLAGSSHFLGVIPALAFPTQAEAYTYMGAFGIGTILAMVLFATTIGMMSRGFAGTGVRAYQGFMVLCSLAAVGIGIYWLVA
jgi:sulfite exporter TauE/SafE